VSAGENPPTAGGVEELNDYLVLALGLVCAGLGGELFIRGTVGLAARARVLPAVVAVTVAAFATSSPELTVAVNAAAAGDSQISVGTVLGSNVVNVALVLGLALAIAGFRVGRREFQRDFWAALLAPVLLGLLAIDGRLSHLDGIIMLSVFAAWLATVVRMAWRKRGEQNGRGPRPALAGVVIASAAGLVLLLLAGRLVVSGARGIALVLGMNEFLVSATIVAVGTSIPELATTVLSALRGQSEVGLGVVLGSNVWNTLLILGLAATITPVAISLPEFLVALAFGSAAVAALLPGRSQVLGRGRSVLLFALYAGYLAAVIAMRSEPR
jgi:cation:H+ antiporter